MSLPTVSEHPAANRIDRQPASYQPEPGPAGLPQQRSSEDIVIELQRVSVQYRMPNQRIGSFKSYLIHRLQGKVAFRHHTALKDVDLNVSQGEIVGLIGHNGAGKSTLLKVVARVMKPNTGRVVVRGKVAPLLAVGAGFHPELTGRENVILNGTLLGFTRRQMEDKFEAIVDFAELWDFIDQPLRTYSSGMRARLGFAVATDTQPDILIVDEVLSVGDESFREKSAERMRGFRERGTTILIVSHGMQTIREICHRVAWIHEGEIRMEGDAGEVVDAYVNTRPHRAAQHRPGSNQKR